MYRIFTEQDGKKLWLSAPKSSDGYFHGEVYRIKLTDKQRFAKKFSTLDFANEFMADVLTGGKEYYEQRDKKMADPNFKGYLSEEYEEYFNRKNYALPRELVCIEWQIEAIHNLEKLTHDQLCKIACTFLRERDCVLIANQPTGYANGENPDAIGFHTSRECHVVEVKTSRADFLSDKNKYFRANPEFGMGVMRWYMCEPELIKQDELPDDWGLVYAYNEVRDIIVEAKPQKSNIHAEMDYLYNTARRGIGGKDGWDNG
jgi:hypothetical protein